MTTPTAPVLLNSEKSTNVRVQKGAPSWIRAGFGGASRIAPELTSAVAARSMTPATCAGSPNSRSTGAKMIASDAANGAERAPLTESSVTALGKGSDLAASV